MGGIQKHLEAHEARLKRLAKAIDTLAERDDEALRHVQEVATLRHIAATELHALCALFVSSINSLLTTSEPIVLDPPESTFQEDGPNLIQMNARGRILQIAYEATPQLVSTEEFRVPYTLSGSVRAFNQELLDRDVIDEQLIFYTVEKGRNMWRFFDARTYRSGPLDEEFFIALMEALV